MLVTACSRLLLVLLSGIVLAGCELAGDIFQAGMAVGVFIVIAFVAIVVFLFSKLRRKV